MFYCSYFGLYFSIFLFARLPLKVKYRYTKPSSSPKNTRKYKKVTRIVFSSNPKESMIDPRNGMNIPINISSST